MNRQEIAKAILATSQTFSKALSEDALELYIRALERFDADRVRRALFDLTVESPSMRMPTVGQIVFYVREQRPAIQSVGELQEPETTPEDHEYGHYQCQFAIWLMGARRAGTRREPACFGVYHTKPLFKHDGKSRWREAEDPKRRAELWLQFLNDQQAPNWLIDEAKADMPVFEVEK